MQKSLLLTAFAAFALTASAQKPQTQVRSYQKDIESVTLKSKSDFNRNTRRAHRLTQNTPTATMYRGGGVFWMGVNYEYNGSGAYGLAAPGVDITFDADVTGESSKWHYVSAVGADGRTFTYSDKEITTSDSTLTMNFADAYVPNPELTSTSQVGTSRLNAKAVTDTAAVLFEGLQFGGGTYGYFSDTDESTGQRIYYDFPICNFNLNDFAGTSANTKYLGVNSAAAGANLGPVFDVSNMTIKSAAEYFINTTEAPMYITGGDIILVSDAGAPSAESLVGEVLSDEDLSVVGTFYVDDVKTITNSAGAITGYGVHFKASKPIEAKGNVLFNVRPAEGSDYTFSPRIVVVTDNGDGNYGYIMADFTANDVDYEDQFIGNDIFDFNDNTLHASGWLMGLTMSFSKAEADAVLGIHSASNTTKADAAYDLQGRRVAKTEKGIYVVNGTKVIK